MATENLTKVDVALSRSTPHAVNIVLGLYDTDILGKPTGAALATASVVHSSLPVSFEGNTTTFTISYALDDTKQYAFVIYPEASLAGSNVRIYAAADGGYEVYRLSSSDGGTSWTISGSVNSYAMTIFTDAATYTITTGGGTSNYMYSDNYRFGNSHDFGFVGAAGKASNPTPTHQSTGNRLNTVDLSWDAGADATSYNVYAQSDAGGTMSQIASLHPNVYITLPWQFRPGYSQTYSWRVDSVNAAGVTTGDVWTWDTMAYQPMQFNPAGGGYADEGGAGVPAGGWSPGGAIVSPVTRLIVAANNKIFYEDI